MTGTTAPGPAIDPQRWPDVASMPSAPLRAALARLAFGRAARRLGLHVTTPGEAGTEPAPLPAREPDQACIVLHRPADFFRRLGTAGPTGFAEAYMAGDWDTPDLAFLLTTIGVGYARLVPAPLRPLRPLLAPGRPAAEDQTIAGSRRNIERHYDLPPEMFATFLDETMTYSCALFARDDAGALAGSLAAAQRRKITAILDLARVGPGTRLLEIGTGWGALALAAASRGALVLTITNSPAQHAAASRRVRESGAASRVSVRLLDYRDVRGQFDAVVSVEMIEAVGRAYWPAYFAAIDTALAPGGRAVIQAITLPHRRMQQVSRSHSWMDKYIFPGAVIPSRQAIESALSGHTTLRVTSVRPMAAHYARTLSSWNARFTASQDRVLALGLDAVFCRMWRFYLAYCEAGFRSGLVNVGQYLLERGS